MPEKATYSEKMLVSNERDNRLDSGHSGTTANTACRQHERLLPGDADRSLEGRDSRKEETSQCFSLAGEFCLLGLFLHFHNQCTRRVPSSVTHQRLVLPLCSRSAREIVGILL